MVVVIGVHGVVKKGQATAHSAHKLFFDTVQTRVTEKRPT